MKSNDINHFIQKAKAVHGDRYDYSETVYTRRFDFVTIRCKIHGYFQVLAGSHMSGRNCSKCANVAMVRKSSRKSLSKRNWNFEQPEDYKLIPLNNGMTIKVDNEDFETLRITNWCYNSKGYAFNNIIGLLHRLVMNCPKGMVVDHINHDILDNRKSNLRLCTHEENMRNQTPQRGGTSIYKGVSWNTKRRRFIACIKIDKKTIYLGQSKDEVEAARMYNEGAIKYHGEFAKLNVIKNETDRD